MGWDLLWPLLVVVIVISERTGEDMLNGDRRCSCSNFFYLGTRVAPSLSMIFAPPFAAHPATCKIRKWITDAGHHQPTNQTFSLILAHTLHLPTTNSSHPLKAPHTRYVRLTSCKQAAQAGARYECRQSAVRTATVQPSHVKSSIAPNPALASLSPPPRWYRTRSTTSASPCCRMRSWARRRRRIGWRRC